MPATAPRLITAAIAGLGLLGPEDIVTDEVAIGEGPAGGATDIDASATYDLTELLAGLVLGTAGVGAVVAARRMRARS